MNHFNSNMNKPKAVALLKRARQLVKDNHHSMICFAIGRAEREAVGNGQSHYLQEWIQSMLGPYDTYSEWVRHNHPRLYEGLTYEQRVEKAKQARLAWIDWMIGELQ